ncbi:DUF952 domain-containing protein [Rubripirellula amarantea]|nr:DUF952 domain-containing protein [Rubripirellula amarantea]
MNPAFIYKILPRTEWETAKKQGAFRGCGIDLTDGFIHLSSADQYASTLQLHFANQTDLIRVAVDGERLGDALKWEESRGGELFPHVYGEIPMSAVVSAAQIN